MSLRTAYPTFFRLAPPWIIAGSRGPRTACFRLLRLLAHVVFFRWWTWRITRRLILAAVLLVTFVSLVYTVENWRGRRAFAAVAREAAAAGTSLNLRDHAQPSVPDDQNLAKIPVLDAPTDPVAAREFWAALGKKLNPEGRNPAFSSSLESITLPKNWQASPLENTPADLAVLRAEMDRWMAKPYDQESLDAFLARISPLLTELGAAAARRPYLRYDYDWENPMSIIVSGVGPMRELACAASTIALIHLEGGTPAAAAEALALPLRLRMAIQRDPFLISQFTAIDMDSIALASVWQGQITHAWTAAELDLFATLLADDRILDCFRAAFAAETAWSVTILLQLPHTIRGDPEIFNSEASPLTVSLLAHWAPSGWLQQNAASAAHFHLHGLIPAIEPNVGRLYPDRIPPIDQSPHTAFRPYDAISRMMLPTVGLILKSAGQAKTTHDLARIAVALEQHLLARGAYPESLVPVQSADPKLAALHDPFTGEPYRYRRDVDGGFTLWGVGRNARDDGSAYPAAKDKGSADYETGDLVWRVPGR